MCEVKLAETLTRLRTEKGVTQEEIAAALGVSNRTISKWETGASAPDLAMLAALADYYAVSTDALLGLARKEDQTADGMIRRAFAGLDRRAVILKAFDVTAAIFPASYDAFSYKQDDCNDEVDLLPPKLGLASRSCVTDPQFFDLVVASEEVNLAVMLLRNKAKFAWLRKPEKQTRIAALFAFLGDPAALTVCAVLHSTACPESFTADFIAKAAGLPEEKVAQVLDGCCEIGLCTKVTAHLRTGEINVYECLGDGKILTLITLAYEHMCGKQTYNYNYNGRCKMIGGERK